jgi:hypothetical protein
MITRHPYSTAQYSASPATVGLAVDAYRFPACRALPEYVDRVGAGVDDLADPFPDLIELLSVDGGDEHAALDAVAVGLQDGGDAGAAVIVADVIGDDVRQRHDIPVHGVSGSRM